MWQPGPTATVRCSVRSRRRQDAKRILELGTALALHSRELRQRRAQGEVDTIERDGEHVRLARANIAGPRAAWMLAGCNRETSTECCRRLAPGYDMAFLTAHTPALSCTHGITLLRPARRARERT